MEIQNRDKEILTLCYEQQFLLISHIRDYFFHGNYSEAKRRVRELRAANLLRNNPNSHQRSRVLELTKEGRAIAKLNSPAVDLKASALDIATLEHHSIVTEVRLEIQKRWDGRWIPELAARAANLVEIPDGIFLFHETGHDVLIEVENSIKGRSRFENRLKHWQHDSNTLALLYIATTEDIYNTLQRYLESAPKSPAHILMRLSELKAEEPAGWTTSGEVLPFGKRSY